MPPSVEKLRELLVAPGHIKEADFAAAVAEAAASSRTLTDILIERDLVKDADLGQLLAEDLGVKFLNLKQEKIDQEVFILIPELVARANGVIAAGRISEGVRVGMVDPSNLELRQALEKRFAAPVIPHYLTRRDLEEALANYRGGFKEEINVLAEKLASASLNKEEHNELAVRLVNAILEYGYESKASDIHLEPSRESVLIRFRIDGVMHDIMPLPGALNEGLVTRLKVLSRLRLDEHLSAQDGKLQFLARGAPVDVRVSILPVTAGENVVLRILSEVSRRFTLTDLGLLPDGLAKVTRAIDNPHGMILVTGPTGSGKTTTVYAVMKILNKREVHISTIEDPVEYEIKGVSQIQVNAKTNLSFAAGLRSIVRQDPDIIMVGEIRDEETAGIAVNSAMTGHLVLSTLHANDAPTTLPRLLDMGVEPFLIASTVNVVIAQRLVRQICSRCRESQALTAEEKKLIKGDEHLKKLFAKQGYAKLDGLTLYRGKGCPLCHETGFAGRVGIFEVMEITEPIKALIVARRSSSEILEAAVASGMTTMLEDGITKVLSGLTTLEEVLRVIRI